MSQSELALLPWRSPKGPASTGIGRGEAMVSRVRRDLDPLDREIMERAIEGVWDVLKGNKALVDLESDEELEIALRRELTEIAYSNRVSDPEALLDTLVADLCDRYGTAGLSTP